MRERRCSVVGMPHLLTAHDFDHALAECLDELPSWVLERLDEVVIRAEMRPPVARAGTLRTFDPARLVIYREPVLERASSRRQLRGLVRAELLRAVVDHLELDGPRAIALATEVV